MKTTVAAGLLLAVIASGASAEGPFQATGIKVGEVSPRSALVWTRLTRHAAPNPETAPEPILTHRPSPDGDPLKSQIIGVAFPDGVGPDDVRGAVPGAPGEVRVGTRVAGTSEWAWTPWQAVDPERDFTRQFELTGLEPATRYELRSESRADAGPGSAIEGGFRTAPRPDEPARVVFTVSTCQKFNKRDAEDGFKIYPSMRTLDPDFFVHTGDMVYYGTAAGTVDLARHVWQRMYALPTQVEFHRQVGSYFMKDDHDLWQNDCYPALDNDKMFEFTFAQGQQVFREQVPIGETPYRTRRWGRDLQVWFVESRDFRSPNGAPDGPDKTIWGAEQKAWFKRTVAASDASFRVLFSPTPIVGPDRPRKKDNHSNAAWAHEGNELREFIASQQNLVVVNGDRHWQYMSVHPTTKVREYSCGPASNDHAAGWDKNDFREDVHRYLRIKGGFLSGTVERRDGVPTLTFRFHNPHGKVRYEDRLVARRPAAP